MTFWIIFLAFEISLFVNEREPMTANFQNSASYRWLNKKVLESRVLDDMENLDQWEAFTSGAQQVVDARVVAEVSKANRMITEMTLTREKSHGFFVF